DSPVCFSDPRGTKSKSHEHERKRGDEHKTGNESASSRSTSDAPTHKDKSAHGKVEKAKNTSIFLSEKTFGTLRDAMGKDGDLLRFGKLKSNIITVHVNGKQEKLRLPEGFGVLQVQNGPANSFGSFLGRQLAEIIATKERILITANGMMDLHQNFYNPKIDT